MLKRQEKAMTTVSNQVPRYNSDRHDILSKIVHHNGYAYVTDTYQVYRIPSGQPDSFIGKYPVNELDKFMSRTEKTTYTAYPVNTDVAISKDGKDFPLDLCKIGKNYYNLKYIKQAIKILGKNITCYQDNNKQFSPLIFESEEGSGCLCPIRYIPD